MFQDEAFIHSFLIRSMNQKENTKFRRPNLSKLKNVLLGKDWLDIFQAFKIFRSISDITLSKQSMLFCFLFKIDK